MKTLEERYSTTTIGLAYHMLRHAVKYVKDEPQSVWILKLKDALHIASELITLAEAESEAMIGKSRASR